MNFSLSSSPLARAIVRLHYRYTERVLRRLNRLVGLKASPAHPATTVSDYVAMQRRSYEKFAGLDKVRAGDIESDHVVGSWRAHDEWPDYEEYLMRYVPKDASWVALEYGCGPGRNIRRWSSLFQRIDGVDISRNNLINAGIFLEGQIPEAKAPRLFLTKGTDCGDAPHGAYDFVFSTICLQHICVYSVRYAVLTSLFACLKPGGRISVQMGFGVPSPRTSPYAEDYVQAIGTNRHDDVAIASAEEPKADLEKIGFIDFESWVRPVGPGDIHPHWIFFTATKGKAA